MQIAQRPLRKHRIERDKFIEFVADELALKLPVAENAFADRFLTISINPYSGRIFCRWREVNQETLAWITYQENIEFDVVHDFISSEISDPVPSREELLKQFAEKKNLSGISVHPHQFVLTVCYYESEELTAQRIKTEEAEQALKDAEAEAERKVRLARREVAKAERDAQRKADQQQREDELAAKQAEADKAIREAELAMQQLGQDEENKSEQDGSSDD